MEQCRVPGCTNQADLEVILYDFYVDDPSVFFQQDSTCPYICLTHAAENEQGMRGVRQPRGGASYPYTNRHGALGFTIYRPLQSKG